MAKKKEKLTPVPAYKPPKRTAGSGRGQSSLVGAAGPATASTGPTAPPPPDLSHIAEALRSLAVPIGGLQFDPSNTVKHDEKNLDGIRGSLAVYGQQKPVVVRRATMTVVCGNGTLAAALSLGWSHLAASVVEMDAATAAGLSIADNRTSDLHEWDKDALDKMLREVSTGNDERLDAMMSALAAEQKLIPKDSADAGAQPPEPDAPRWHVLVECVDQEAQQALLAAMSSEGRKCRPFEGAF